MANPPFDYTPKSIADIVFHDDATQQLIDDIVTGAKPFPYSGVNAVLLFGTYGTGKSALATLLPEAIETARGGGPADPRYERITAGNNNVELVASALRAALVEIGRWNSTLIMTYAEFGRRPRENLSNGTDHGTANAHFLFGGRVKGGLYGLPPALGRLDGNGNLPFAVDFRDLYATVLGEWWGLDASRALNGRFAPLDLLKA